MTNKQLQFLFASSTGDILSKNKIEIMADISKSKLGKVVNLVEGRTFDQYELGRIEKVLRDLKAKIDTALQ